MTVGKSKVVFEGDTLLDLTADTVTPETLLKGATAHNAAGEAITGTLEAGASTDWAAIAMQNIGEILAIQAHNGNSFAPIGIQADAFQDNSLWMTYSGGLLFINKRLEFVLGCSSEATVNFSGSKAFNAEITSSEVSREQAWVEIFRFRPDGYGYIKKLTLQTISSASMSTPAHMKLGLWIGASTKLLETSLGEISRDSNGIETPIEFAISQSIDPNKYYRVCLWIEDKTETVATLSYVKFNSSPTNYSAGTLTCCGLAPLDGAARIHVLVHATAATPTVYIRFTETGATFTALSLIATTNVTLPDGTACKRLEYTADIPDDAVQIQPRFTLGSTACKVYDYAIIQTP